MALGTCLTWEVIIDQKRDGQYSKQVWGTKVGECVWEMSPDGGGVVTSQLGEGSSSGEDTDRSNIKWTL